MEGNGIANPRIEYGVVIAKQVPFLALRGAQRRGKPVLAPSPLMGEGWGEGENPALTTPRAS